MLSISRVFGWPFSRSSVYLVVVLATFLTGCKSKLTVEPPSGGDIVSVDSNINCGAQCAYDYDKNTAVELNPTAQDGYQFINWTGECSGAATPCNLVMDAPKTVGALFLETDDPAIGSPISVTAGTQITLTYSGSTDDADEIGIYLPESENNNPEVRVRLPDQAGSVQIRVPRIPGDYELRMVNDKDELIVFDGVLDVQPYAGTIDPSVTATTPTRRISVAFTGSTHSTDRLGIFAIGSDNTQPLKSASLSQDEGSVEIEVPAAEGTYEFRIVTNDRYTIAIGPQLTLEYGNASIVGPNIVLPEEVVTITYTGSTETRDRVALFAQIANGYRSSRTTNGSDGQMELEMPDETGIYDLALINSGQYRIANGGYISVLNPEKAEVFPAPELARINETLTIAYSGAESVADSLDWVGLFRQGEPVENFLQQAFVPEGTPVGNVSFNAPAVDDIYEVRLVANDGSVRASHYVYVQDPSVNAVFIPQSIVAGDTVIVPFSKPEGGSGRIAIYPQGEADHRGYVASATANSALGYVQLRVPTTPGDYEVRAIDSAYELVVQGNEFVVTPYDVSLTLSTAFTTPADTISATYAGSTHQTDRLGFYLPGAANNDYEASVTLRDDEGVATVRVPGIEGVYDVRVINNLNETMLDAGQITLSYGELALSAAEIAYPGEIIPVSFEGSTETTDKVIMVAQDTTNAVRSVNTGDLSSGDVDFRVPSEPGIYDLKLVNPTNAVIALGGFVSVLDPADKAVFVAPETVHVGDTVTIAYSGSQATIDAPERVGIYVLDATNDSALTELSVTDIGQGVVTMATPDLAGIYEVRLINADGSLAATSNHLKVINSAEQAVYAPILATAGETVKVIFSGSANDNDRVRFVAEGETNLRNYTANVTARDAEGWLSLRVPTIPGRYEVKMVTSTDEELAAGNVFTVNPYDASLSIQSFATPSSTIDFQYSGSTATSDVLGLYVQGGTLNDRVASRTLSEADGSASIRMPASEGTYELKIVNNKREVILDAGLIEVAYETSISLSAQAFAVPGVEIPVTFEGSTQTGDRLLLRETTSPVVNDVAKSRTTGNLSEGELNLDTPTEPGIYALEMENSGRVLMASGGIVNMLDATTLGVYADARITPPGGSIHVAYSGALNSDDSVGLFAQAADNITSLDEVVLGSSDTVGSSVLTAPVASGVYDVRLLNVSRDARVDPRKVYVLDDGVTGIYSTLVVRAGETVPALFASADTAPDMVADKVAFYPLGSTNQADVISPTRVRSQSGAVDIRVPTIAGEYVLRLVNASYGVISSSETITVLPYDGDIDP